MPQPPNEFTNPQKVAEVLERIAVLLELKGENPFKTRAYTYAARALETLAEDLPTLVAEGRLQEIDGIGKAISEKISTLVQTGRLDYYDALREEFPPDIFTLFEVQGLGAKKIKVLYEALGISSLTKLERACRAGKVAELPGFGQKTSDNILKGLEQHKKSAGQFRIGDITTLAEELLDDLRSHPRVTYAQIAGSYRRRKEIVRDLDFIVSTRKPAEVSEDFVNHPLVESVLAKGETKSSVILKNGMQCDLRVVTSAEYPFALNYFTGSKEHNVRMRSRALERGWSLNEYRFSEAGGRTLKEPIPEVRTEADIYKALGLDYVEPELREDRGEIEAAADHALPRLIEWQNLRGTFHNHTTASDEKRLLAQIEAIRALNAGFDGFRIFAGVECDIRKDGSLDFSDEILSRLDYVVASVHASFTVGEAEMTRRIIRAMANPHVTMLGHLTGRLLLTREPYAVNIPAVIEAAAESGTIIELNANSRRLDMDWRWWPLAREKGVKCAINPDAHSTAGLQELIFGIGAARKGWLTKDDVVNTLPLGKIETVLGAKRMPG